MLARRIPDHSETPEAMYVSLVTDIEQDEYLGINATVGDNIAVAENTHVGRYELKQEAKKVAKITGNDRVAYFVINMN